MQEVNHLLSAQELVVPFWVVCVLSSENWRQLSNSTQNSNSTTQLNPWLNSNWEVRFASSWETTYDSNSVLVNTQTTLITRRWHFSWDFQFCLLRFTSNFDDKMEQLRKTSEVLPKRAARKRRLISSTRNFSLPNSCTWISKTAQIGKEYSKRFSMMMACSYTRVIRIAAPQGYFWNTAQFKEDSISLWMLQRTQNTVIKFFRSVGFLNC